MTADQTTNKTDDDVEQWLDNIDVDPADVRDAQHVRRISAAVRALGVADAEVTAAVIAARNAGDSWGMIGVALGVSRQAAFKRYSKIAPSATNSA